MLTCQQLTERITDYLEGRLSLSQRLSFQTHIWRCGDCRAYLRQMKMTVRTLGSMPAAPVPAAVRDELLLRFRHARPRATTAAGRVPVSLGVLAGSEKLAGSTRGWVIAGLMPVVAVLYALGSGLGWGPAGNGLRCVLAEIASGGAFLGVLAVLARARGASLSSATWVAITMTGSLLGFFMLEALMCPMAHVAPHVLIFHIGGLVLAGAMGAAASRLPAFR
jgi:anti-sigma factor RsiW